MAPDSGTARVHRSEEMGSSARIASSSRVASTPQSVQRNLDSKPSAHGRAVETFGTSLDQSLNYMISQFTRGLSPAGLAEAYFDWMVHLAAAPGKQAELADKAIRKWYRLLSYATDCGPLRQGVTPCIAPLPQDKRFKAEEWHSWPFNVIHQSFLLGQQWWHNATTGVRGVTRQHENEVSFATRQILDVFSPANFVLTNPEVLRQTQAELGQNLIRGYCNFIEDWWRLVTESPPVGTENFNVGEKLALSPGKVVYRNHLIELIQYEPKTAKVRPEPILIVPAWIMKYYILDLRPGRSMVEYLTQQGFTVFMISWRNPTAEDRNLSLDDYRRQGVLAAVDAVQTIVPKTPIHGVGYCLGGTLLAIAAAALARDNRHSGPFKSLTFFAAQVDFEEAGELMLFINESQLMFLEDVMRVQGYLASEQMAGAFQLLRSQDLIWSRVIRDYLMGQREPMFDLMAWNADTTRMPFRMHSEYLRWLFQDNQLAEGHFMVDGRPIALTDIRAPMFCVGTETDHVAPWRSAYKMNILTDTDVTFLLTSGGHNAGVVSEPSESSRRSYRVHTKGKDDFYIDPDRWLEDVPRQQGSWWPAWADWLGQHSGGWTSPPSMGAPEKGLAPIVDAPGLYVMQR